MYKITSTSHLYTRTSYLLHVSVNVRHLQVDDNTQRKSL